MAVISFAASAQSPEAIEAQRRDWFYRQRAYPHDRIPAGARARALAEMSRMRPAAGSRKSRPEGAATEGWKSIGPSGENVILFPQYGAPVASGRVSALAVDPRDPNTVYAGGAAGGIWKSTDGGINWTPLTDDQPSLAIGSIALAPSNPDVIYVGTGEQNNSGDSYYGAGVLKSTDAGKTWQHLPGNFVGPFSSTFSGGGYRLGAIAVHPTNPNIVLAGGSREIPDASGVFRSTDGGQSWTPVLTGSAATELFFNPSDGQIAYAALGRGPGDLKYGVFKSTDSGQTWSAINGSGATALPTNQARIAMAVAPSNPNTLYVGMAATSGSLRGFFRSTDAGATWTQMPAPDYCAPQCGYDNVIRVHPSRPDVVVAAGDSFGTFQSNGIYRTLNGGASWTGIMTGANGNSPHSDHHALAFTADGNKLYDGNDGGVYSAGDVTAGSVSWANLNSTLAIAAISPGFDMHPKDPGLVYAGTQDNGTLKYTGRPTWDQVFGGDGERVQVDFSLPTTVYVSTFGSAFYKITDQGNFQNYVPVVHGINQRDRVAFTAALAIDPSDPDRLYMGTFRVYQTIDGAGLWTPISPDLTATSGGAVNAIAVAPASPQVVYAGTTDSQFRATENALDGVNASWENRSSGLPPRVITSITVDQTDARTVYVTFSGFSGFRDQVGHVFKSVDGGKNWADISGNLPNIPANDVVIDPDIADTLYLATDIGVFWTGDAGATWAPLSSGLPRTVVSALKLHRGSRLLRAGTHGRSMWELPLPSANHGPAISSVTPPTAIAGSNDLNLTISGANFAANTTVRWNGEDRPTKFVNNATLQTTIPASDLALPGRGTLQAFSPEPGGGASNGTNFVIGPAPAIGSPGVVNSAFPQGGSVLVPGGIATIYGSDFAQRSESAAAPPLPSTLAGVKVELAGLTPVPLLFVSPNQINFQVPWSVMGFATAALTVINGSLTSPTITVKVVDVAPGLYSLNGRGTGQGVIYITGTQGTVAGPAGSADKARPARRGELIEIYATGLGDVTNNPPIGSAAPTSPLSITHTPDVTIGGVPAQVLFSGLSPGSVGLYQINVRVPDAAPSGPATPVQIQLGTIASNTVTMAVE